MSTDGEGSVTRWIGHLKQGSDDAARRLWERYFGQLVRLAHARLRDRPRAAADEEDVALSAFDSFFAGVARGRFPRLSDRHDLWHVLATITARKAADQVEREGRRKRGGGRVLGEADLARCDARAGGGLDQVAGAEPTPEIAVMVLEQARRLFDALPDETLRLVALLKLEGYSNEKIAANLDCGLRSVERKLERIRKRWLEEESL